MGVAVEPMRFAVLTCLLVLCAASVDENGNPEVTDVPGLGHLGLGGTADSGPEELGIHNMDNAKMQEMFDSVGSQPYESREEGIQKLVALLSINNEDTQAILSNLDENVKTAINEARDIKRQNATEYVERMKEVETETGAKNGVMLEVLIRLQEKEEHQVKMKGGSQSAIDTHDPVEAAKLLEKLMPEMTPWDMKGEHSGKVFLQLFARLVKLSKEKQRAGVKMLGLHVKHTPKWHRAIREEVVTESSGLIEALK